MGDTEMLNIDSIIARLLEGEILMWIEKKKKNLVHTLRTWQQNKINEILA